VSASLDINVVIDIGDVEKGFDAMERRAHALRAVFSQLRKTMREDQRDHARKKQGAEGHWPPRKKLTSGTKKAARYNHRKLLGRLPTAISIRANSDRIVAVSKVAWSSIHQEGGRAGKGAHIPKRQFLWISDALLKTAADLATEHVVGGF